MALSLTEFRATFNAPLRDGLVEIIDNNSKILPLMNFIGVDDLRYEYVRRNALPTVTTRALGAEYTDTNSTPVRASEPLAILGGLIKIDNQLFNKRGQALFRVETTGMAKAAGLHFDKLFFDGDIATTSTHFDGLNVRCTGNQLITAGANGAALTLSMVDDLLDRVRGSNDRKALLMSKAVRRKLKQLLVATAGGAAISDVGPSLMSYDGARIVEIEEDQTNAAILGYDETVGSSNVTASMYCVRFGGATDEEDVQGLIGSRFMDVDYQGLRGTQHYAVLDANLGIGLFHPEAAARLRGILNA